MAAAVLLLAVISAPSAHAQSDVPSRDTSYDADALAGWVQFLKIAKSADGHPITDDMLRSRFGNDVKRLTTDRGGYQDLVDYRKSDGHGFDVTLAYLTMIHTPKVSGPGSTLEVNLTAKGCLDRDKAKADLTAAGFGFFQTQTAPVLTDHYFAEGGHHVEVLLRTAIRARTPLQEMKDGPRAALICVTTARITL
jgi:hypothetical protein